jgi:hypothetical protein
MTALTTTDLSVALTSSQGFAINGGTASDYSGYSVSAAGDVNNDNFVEIIICISDIPLNNAICIMQRLL